MEHSSDEGNDEVTGAGASQLGLLSPAQLSYFQATFQDDLSEARPLEFQQGTSDLPGSMPEICSSPLRTDDQRLEFGTFKVHHSSPRQETKMHCHSSNIPLPQKRKRKQKCYSTGNAESATEPAPIKRPLNSFMLYRRMKQSEIPLKNHQRVSRVIGALWRNETAETKAHFTKLADMERATHLREFPNYKFSPKKRKNDGVPTRTASNKPKIKSAADENAEEIEVLRALSGSSERKARNCASDIAAATIARSEYTNNSSSTYDSPQFEQLFSMKDAVTTKINHGGLYEDIFLRPTSSGKHKETNDSKVSPQPVGLGLSGIEPISEPSSSITEMGEADVDAYFAALQSCSGSMSALTPFTEDSTHANCSNTPYHLHDQNPSSLGFWPVEDEATFQKFSPLDLCDPEAWAIVPTSRRKS